jgi:hypothetical protein
MIPHYVGSKSTYHHSKDLVGLIMNELCHIISFLGNFILQGCSFIMLFMQETKLQKPPKLLETFVHIHCPRNEDGLSSIEATIVEMSQE